MLCEFKLLILINQVRVPHFDVSEFELGEKIEFFRVQVRVLLKCKL